MGVSLSSPRDADGIGIELETAVRSGMLFGGTSGQGAVPLTTIVPQRMIGEVWRMLDEFTESLPRSGDGE